MDTIILKIGVIGGTNVGKSTLLRHISSSCELHEPKLETNGELHEPKLEMSGDSVEPKFTNKSNRKYIDMLSKNMPFLSTGMTFSQMFHTDIPIKIYEISTSNTIDILKEYIESFNIIVFIIDPVNDFTSLENIKILNIVLDYIRNNSVYLVCIMNKVDGLSHDPCSGNIVFNEPFYENVYTANKVSLSKLCEIRQVRNEKISSIIPMSLNRCHNNGAEYINPGFDNFVGHMRNIIERRSIEMISHKIVTSLEKIPYARSPPYYSRFILTQHEILDKLNDGLYIFTDFWMAIIVMIGKFINIVEEEHRLFLSYARGSDDMEKMFDLIMENCYILEELIVALSPLRQCPVGHLRTKKRKLVKIYMETYDTYLSGLIDTSRNTNKILSFIKKILYGHDHKHKRTDYLKHVRFIKENAIDYFDNIVAKIMTLYYEEVVDRNPNDNMFLYLLSYVDNNVTDVTAFHKQLAIILIGRIVHINRYSTTKDYWKYLQKIKRILYDRVIHKNASNNKFIAMNEGEKGAISTDGDENRIITNMNENDVIYRDLDNNNIVNTVYEVVDKSITDIIINYGLARLFSRTSINYTVVCGLLLDDDGYNIDDRLDMTIARILTREGPVIEKDVILPEN